MFKYLRCLPLLSVFFAGCILKVGPERYLASVEEIQSELASRMHDLIKYSEDLDSTMLWKALDQTKEYAEMAVLKLQEQGTYKGDSLLFKSALHLLDVYQQVLKEDIPQMARIVSQPGELSDAEEIKLQRMRRIVFNKLAGAERDYLKSANEFRRKYIGLALPEDDSDTWFEEENDTSGVKLN